MLCNIPVLETRNHAPRLIDLVLQLYFLLLCRPLTSMADFGVVTL